MNIRKRAYVTFGILTLIYAALTFGIPPDPAMLQKYHISALRAETIYLTFVIPFALIWFAGVFGSVHLLQYASAIKKGVDGVAFRLIGLGLGVLAFRFPVMACISTVLNYYARTNPQLVGFTVIFNNYLSVIAAVVGFWLISDGATHLLRLSSKQPALRGRVFYILLTVGLAVAYSYLAIGRPGYQTPVVAGERATYYLPSWLIVSTIILPYVYAWYRGFTAVFDLYFYRRNVPGRLYKQSLRLLSVGIGAVVVSSIFLQFLGAQSSRLNRLHLAPLLLWVYGLLILIAVGFVAVALGAKKLKKIEEV